MIVILLCALCRNLCSPILSRALRWDRAWRRIICAGADSWYKSCNLILLIGRRGTTYGAQRSKASLRQNWVVSYSFALLFNWLYFLFLNAILGKKMHCWLWWGLFSAVSFDHQAVSLSSCFSWKILWSWWSTSNNRKRIRHNKNAVSCHQSCIGHPNYFIGLSLSFALANRIRLP